MKKHRQRRLDFERRKEAEMFARAKRFCSLMQRRRSVRHFSADPVPRALIEYAIQTAGSAPSGANRQPWRFVAIADTGIKKKIRLAAEKEEQLSYQSRMPQEWLKALEPLGTDWQKGFLETAPWIVVLFAVSHELSQDGQKRKNYYVQESVGIACGIFVAAIHNLGLATLTHTPSPMGFLSEILDRPKNERPFLLFPVGYPAEDALVPELKRKNLGEISVWHE
jgi:nitroreductase